MALLDEIRQKNPSLRDRSDDELKAVLRQSPEFKYFDDNEFNAFVSGQEAQASESSPGFMSGVSAGVDQLQAMGGGLVMAAGEAMESEGMLNAGRNIYQRNMDQASENELGYGFTDIRSAGDAWNWARYTAGNQLPMLAASVAGGGVGGAAAGLTARTLAGATVKEGAKRVGQALGAAGASTGMETGALMGETENLDVSLAHGLMMGSLDAITPIKMLRAAGKSELADQAASEISDRVLADLQREAARTTRGAAGRGSLTSFMAESTTEGLQGLIGQHANYWVENNGESLLANLGEVDLKAFVDEAAAGGLMGGMVGAPVGVMERNQSRTQAQRIEQAREQVAAQGGDALDQATAGLGAEQAAASEAPQPQGPTPEMSADIGNRIQLAMGEVDDLRSMARGSSFEGSTRLRNMSTILDRAERAYEEGNVEQAGRLADRAQGIANKLRSALRQAGTRERPLEGELYEDLPVSGLLGQDSAPRLNAPDPNIINMGGPTADQTQYEPQARNVRRDEGMQAQREGAERLRSQVAGQRPQLAASGTIYGQGPTRDVDGERLQQEQRRRAAFEQQYGTAQNTGLDGEYMGPDPVPGRPNRQGDTYDSETYRRPERLRQDTAPRLAQSDTIYGDGPIAGNANTGMDRPSARDPRYTADPEPTQNLQYRTNGDAFPSERAAMKSGFARRAQRNNQSVSAVPVEGGFALNITQARAPAQQQALNADAATEARAAAPLRGEPIDNEWSAFSAESGTRGIPRAEMPQVKAENRGALANFMNARGIESREETVAASSLRPTQAEFSEARVQGAKDRKGGDRAILVSSDGHIVDGHHQWMAKADQGEDVRIIRLDAPIDDVLEQVREFPSNEAEATRASDTQKADSATPVTEDADAQAAPTEAAEPDTEQATSQEAADEAPKPKRRNKPLQYTGYSGEERSVRSYQEVGDYRIAKLGDNFYEVIDPDGQAVSQMAGPNGAAREAERLNNLSPDDPRYKIGQSDGRPVSSDDIKAALEGSPELADVTVIQSTSELPTQSLLMMALQGVNARDVRGLFVGDQLYVIADNVDSVQEGISTAVHEAVGHKGMRAVLGEDLERVMLNLYRNLPNSKEGREALREVRRDYPFLDPSNRKDQVTIGEEMVAHLLEKGHRPKAWQRAVAKIRELLRRAFPSIAWTYTDALALGEKSREYLQKRQADSRGDDAQLYSIRSKRRVAFEKAFEDFNDNDKAAASKVGEPTITRSAMQWWQEKTNRWQARVRQGLVDQYGPLQEMDEALYGDEALTEKITQSAWVKARQSKAANGVTEVLLKHSRVEWNAKEQIFEPKDDDSMGLGAVLGRLGETAEIHRFLGWIAGNRADKLRAEGRENLFEDADIDAMKTWNRGNTADGTKRDQLYNEVFKDFQQYRDDVLAAGEVLGVISAEQRAAWRDEFYVPFYRISEGKGFEAGQLATSGLTRQQAVKKLKGGTGNLNNLLENTMMNFHHIIDAGLKNNAARQAIDNAQQLGAARKVPESAKGIEHRTFIMRDGNKEFYEIDDPLVYNALASLAHNGMNSSLMKVLRGFKRIFTNTVTVTPQYIIANLMRDSIQAPATSDISKNVLSNILVGNRTLRDQKMKARMLASGASFSFGHLYGTGNADELRAGMTRNLRDAAAADAPGSSLPLGIGNVASVVRYGWARWNDVNNHTENLNRAAIFSQNASEGNKLRAAHEARDLMDFSSHGGWGATRVLIDIIPFLNARIQGLDKIYRSGVKPGGSVIIDALRGKTPNATDKQLAGRFWAVTGAVSLAMLALYLENHDEEWYKELEEWEKDTYTHFNIGSQKFRIPNPFEVGAIGTMMVRTAEQFVDDEATGELFAQRMWHMMTQTFAVGMPQAMQPALDVYANKDSFTNRPIENMGMQNLSPELRKRYNTTVVATGISNLLNSTVGAIGRPETNPLALSPVQVDHLIGGYLGQVGAWGAGMADTIWRTANGHDAPDRKWYEFNPIRRFYGNLDDTDAYTRYGTIFYEGLTETRRAYSDVNELRELGHWEEAKEHFEENRNTLALRRGLNRAQTQLSTFNKQIDIIRRSNIGGELKRQRIDRIQEKKRIIQRTWGERVLQARAT